MSALEEEIATPRFFLSHLRLDGAVGRQGSVFVRNAPEINPDHPGKYFGRLKFIFFSYLLKAKEVRI